MGGKIIPRIRLTSAKDLVEVEAELGKKKSRVNKFDMIFEYYLLGHLAQNFPD